MVRQLFLPASGQHGDNGLGCFHTQLSQHRFPSLFDSDDIQKGVADKRYGYAVAFVKRDFEWKGHGHLVNPLCDLPNTPGTPCPNLWTDVIEYWNLQGFSQPRQTQVK